MRVTIDELNNAGANMSQGYLFGISSPVSYRTVYRGLTAVFETDKIKIGIRLKREYATTCGHTATSNIKRMNNTLNRLTKAIERLEKKHGQRHTRNV